ncbi:MAG: S-adenosylmethionine:tRNA ribosyltransferase-isomerase, partial [Atribacterota bacterium]|nr:S-adenosylmethionine:tRNA ribosyltransferase-isomerase [Atribacterota bacterium]
MNIKDFDYQLPADFIAQEPLTIRHNSKLMVLNKNTGEIQHKNFYQIVDLFQPEDLLILNNSKVLPMRLFGQKKNTGGEIEALLINPISSNVWRALLKPGKRIHNGTIISFSEELEGIVIDKDDRDSTYLVQMNYTGIFNDILYKIGKMPTPPYIKKE